MFPVIESLDNRDNRIIEPQIIIVSLYHPLKLVLCGKMVVYEGAGGYMVYDVVTSQNIFLYR